MTRHTILVGIGYKARCGKGTVAKTIVDRWKDTYDIREYSFGAELKREVNELDDQLEFCVRHGVEYDFHPDMSDPLCNTRHGKQSKLLQWYGTEYRRAEDSYYWVRKLDARLKQEQPVIALISDLRFLNEYYYVRANNGYNIKCNRLGFVDTSRDPNHVSEVELDGATFDYEITVSDGDVDELKKDGLIVFDMILAELNPVIPNIEELYAAA